MAGHELLHYLPEYAALGQRNEKSYRSMFAKRFDWFSFNCEIVKACFGKKKVIAVFDPSYIKKSGKKTYGLAKFYSGTAGRALTGLEIGCLAFVGVSDHTALHALAVQTLHRRICTARKKRWWIIM